MSTKTLRKRIALVAVAALGAGVLSVAPASAATPNDLAPGDITITTPLATSPGVCAIDTTVGTGSIVLVPGRSFTLTTNAGGDLQNAYVTLSGNISFTATSGWATVTQTTAEAVAATGDTLTITAGSVGTGIISIAKTSASAPIEQIAVTVTATCEAQKLSLGDSYVQVRDDAGVATSNVDESAGLVNLNAATSYIALALVDAYGNDLTGSGVLVATATNGAVIAWDGTPSVQSSSAYSSSRGASGTELYVTQGLANANKPLTTTVTISLDGTAIATKSITFQGVPASIEIKDVTVGKVGSVGYFRARVLDAAGNALYSKSVVDDAAANADASVSAIASFAAAATSSATGDWSTTGQGQFNCVKGGVTKLNVKTVVSAVSGTSVKKSFDIACGGVLDTWTVSLDKASYAPGEIATLTVSGKDSKGFPVNSTDTFTAVDYSFGGLAWVNTPGTGDTFTSGAGVKTYKLSVGLSEGSFVGYFKIPGATDTAAKTLQYKVANTTVGVSNADVLKAIVSLIASINKQIAALQKALLKK